MHHLVIIKNPKKKVKIKEINMLLSRIFSFLFLKKVMYHPVDSLEELNAYYDPLYDKVYELSDILTPKQAEFKLKGIDDMYKHDYKVLKYNLLIKNKQKKEVKLPQRMQRGKELAEKRPSQAIPVHAEVMDKNLLEEGEENEE